MLQSRQVLFKLLVLGLFAFTASTAVAQGLVEYALILVMEGGVSQGTYELCASNSFPAERTAEFAFQPSGVSVANRPFDILSLVLELGPYETACMEFTPPSAGVLCQLPSLSENPGHNALLQRNGEVRACYPVDRKVWPAPAVRARVRKDLSTGRLLPVQGWLLDAPGGARQDRIYNHAGFIALLP